MFDLRVIMALGPINASLPLTILQTNYNEQTWDVFERVSVFFMYLIRC